MLKIMCSGLLLAILMTCPCLAGEISLSLEKQLQTSASDSDVEVLVMFSEQADIRSLDEQLKTERATLAERNKRVVTALKETASKTKDEASVYFEQLKSQGYITDYKLMWLANMAIVTATPNGVYAMTENNDIGEITLSYEIENIQPVDVPSEDIPLTASIEPGLEAINAPAAWAAGFTGAGRVVSNVDTGVDGNHPALADRFLGDTDEDGDYDESWLDPFDETNWEFPRDAYSHGTHTMGTICGRTEAGDTIGVAIDAKWIASTAVDRDPYNTNATISDIIESFQWLVDPDNNSETQDNPDVVNNSWGLIPYFMGIYPCDESFWTYIDNLEAAGTVALFAAGNEGNPSSMRSPADRTTTALNCFSVGAVNGNNEYLEIAEFSSRGPSLCTGDSALAIKPEISAPGLIVRSSMPNNSYGYMSGTSMATPHVAGAVALIRQASPNLDVDQVKEVLLACAIDLGDIGPDNSYGQGCLDVYQACLLASSGIGYIDGYVYDDATDNPVAGALVVADGTTKQVFTDANGYYRLRLIADSSFTLTASYYGYYVSTRTGIETSAWDTTTANFELEIAASGVLHGYATDQDGNPVEGISVIAEDTPLDIVSTDSDGYYIFENIAAGATYTINTFSPNHDYFLDTVAVTAADTARLDITLRWFDSFERADGGFTAPEGSLWKLATSHRQLPYHGLKVWCTGTAGYDPWCGDNGCEQSLYTAFYHVTDNNATISFYHWLDIYTGRDGGNLQISTDEGDSWDLLTPVGGYPYSSLEALDGEPGFSGESFVWQFVEFELDGYVNEDVQLRFHFGSAGGELENWYGWYIDGFVFDGASIVAPDAEFSQTFVDVDVQSGDSRMESIPLLNEGLGDLEYDTRVITYPARQNILAANEPQEEGDTDLDVISSTSGPDSFGYFLYDSDEPGGPDYDWIDITDVGTAVSFNGIDMEGCSDTISMGMPFMYYGEEKTAVTITISGCVVFDTCTMFMPDPLSIPVYGDENTDFIAAMWGRQSNADGTCFYFHDSDENRFIISWVNWKEEMEPQGHYNFQVILDGDDNSIVMQYDNVTLGELISVIGIQSSDGFVGLGYPRDLFGGLPDDFAIEFIYPLFWLSVDPQSGTIPPDGSQNLGITFDATDLPDGNYFGEIYFTTNDPYQRTHTVACSLGVGTVDIDDDNESALPLVFSLNQNYPNPFNPTTEIMFNLPRSGHVSLDIYDILGRKVTSLVDEELVAGTHNVIWNSTNASGDKVSSGIYFYKLSQNDNTITKKMVLIK